MDVGDCSVGEGDKQGGGAEVTGAVWVEVDQFYVAFSVAQPERDCSGYLGVQMPLQVLDGSSFVGASLEHGVVVHGY